MSGIKRWAVALGLSSVLIGLAGLTPARADDDDYGRGNYGRTHIRQDIADIRRDENRLRDLERRRDWQARRHNWDAVHDTDRQIQQLRWHIAHDRRDVHQDIRRTRRDRDDYDRDNYRPRRWHDND